MSETQKTLFGGELETMVELEADGRIIRPFKRLLDPIANEIKLHFDSDGLFVEVVDSANVIMTRARLHADALETYTCHKDTTIGIGMDAFGSVLQHARYGKSTTDTVALEVDPKEVQTTVEKEIADTEVTIAERAETIDPNSLREEPNLPGLEFQYELDLSADALAGVLDVFELKSKHHLSLTPTDAGVRFAQGDDVSGRVVELERDAGGSGEETMYSGNYVGDIQTQLQNGLMDTTTVKWADEFPIFVEMEREGVCDVTTMIAPRIAAD
jgi:DNA polymerase III sliding clamp (beta) subunit (PCNA family)